MSRLKAAARSVTPIHGGALGGRECAAFACGIKPDLLDVTLVPLDAELNDDIDQQIKKLFDIGSGELLAALGLFDQEHELLERQLRTRRVHAGDGARVAGVDVA